MTDRLRLVLFTRYPTPGRVKTRLIPALGAAGAAALHRRLTERVIGMLIASGRAVEVRTTGAQASAFHRWLGDVPCMAQGRGHLGARMARAAGETPVILVGADIPDLDIRHIEEAIAALARADVVIGPAEDGGYYLLGLARPCPWLFDSMPWGSDRILALTQARLAARGISPVLLDPLADLDRPEDLARWPDLCP